MAYLGVGFRSGIGGLRTEKRGRPKVKFTETEWKAEKGFSLLVFSFAALLCNGNAMGDLLHLKTGGIVDIGWHYVIDKDRVIVHKEAGTIAIPLSDVSRIEKTERKEALKETPRLAPRKVETEQVPEEAPEAGQTPSTGSGELASIIEEVLSFLERVKESGEIADQDREDGLRFVKAWIHDVEAILGDASAMDPMTREVAEDLVKDLEGLERELGDGMLRSKAQLQRSMKSMLERL